MWVIGARCIENEHGSIERTDVVLISFFAVLSIARPVSCDFVSRCFIESGISKLVIHEAERTVQLREKEELERDITAGTLWILYNLKKLANKANG